MTVLSHEQRMLLTPEDPWATPPSERRLVHQLESMELLGEAFQGPGGRRFLVGERFLWLISFLGCSPHIEIAPPSEGALDFCHLHVLGPFAAPRFLSGRNTIAPGCSGCGKRVRDWRDQIAGLPSVPAAHNLVCPQCRRAVALTAARWRQSAGCGRLFLVVENVFPKEAIPAPELLRGLQAVGGQRWRHFYLQQ